MRFLTTPATFCIVALKRPASGELVISRSLPLREGDKIELLGAPNSDGVSWHTKGKQTVISASKEHWDAVPYAWAFKVTYRTA